jgi:FixJ family two-component response regulator
MWQSGNLSEEANLRMAEARPLVMVVNDDEAMRDSLRFVLQLDGAEVRLHADGAGLLDDPALARTACLVLKEHLPDIDGFEVLGRLRSQGITAPAIFLSSLASAALRRRAARAGVWLVLEKPILDDALVDAVAAVLRGSREAIRTST